MGAVLNFFYYLLTVFSRLGTLSRTQLEDFKPWPNRLASSVASWKLVITCTTCVHLRLLAFTLMKLKFTYKLAQVFFCCLATQRKLTQVCLSIVCTGRSTRARLHWNGFFTTCVQLVSSCDSVWPLIASLWAQVGISNSFWPRLYTKCYLFGNKILFWFYPSPRYKYITFPKQHSFLYVKLH